MTEQKVLQTYLAKKVSNLYLETNWSAADTVRRAVYLLQLAKQNPDDFKVELRQ